MAEYSVAIGKKITDYNLNFKSGRKKIDFGTDRGFSEILQSIFGIKQSLNTMLGINMTNIVGVTEKQLYKAYAEFSKLVEEGLYSIMPELFMKVVRKKILQPIVTKFSQGKYASNQAVQRMVSSVVSTVEYMAENVRDYVSVEVNLGKVEKAMHFAKRTEFSYVAINSIKITFNMFDFEMEMIQEKKNRVFEYAGINKEKAAFPSVKYDRLGMPKIGKTYIIKSRPGIRKNWASSKKMYSLFKILELGVSKSYTIEPVSSRFPNASEKRRGQKGTIKLRYLAPFFGVRNMRLFVGRMRHKPMSPKDKLNIITTKNLINSNIEKAFVAEINAYLRKDGVKKLLTSRIKYGIESMKALKSLNKLYIPGENKNTRIASIRTIHRKKVADKIK